MTRLKRDRLFQWDAQFVPQEGSLVARVNHHANVTIAAASRDAADRRFAWYEAGDWDPLECPER